MKLGYTRKIAALSLLAAMVLSGCGQKEPEEINELIIKVESGKPEQGDLILQSSFIGTVSPEESVMVIPLVAGTVTEANFEVGDAVQAGDVLFKIDDAAVQLQLAQAKLGKASAEVQAATTLGPQQDLSHLQQQATIDQINSQIASATLGIEQSRESRDDYEDQKDELEDKIDDLDDSIKGYQNQLKALRELSAQFKEEVVEGSGTDYPEVGGTVEKTVTIPGIGTTSVTYVITRKSKIGTTDRYNYYYEPYKLGGMTHSEVDASIASLSSGISSMQSAKGNIEASIGSIESAIKSYENGIESAEISLDYLGRSAYIAHSSNAIQNTEILQSTKDSMDIAVKNAQIAVDSTELALSYYTVTAPIAGVIEQKNVKENDLAGTGSPAYVISNKDSMVVTFNVSEDIMKTLTVGDEVSVERNGVYYTGTLTEVQNSVSPQTGLFIIKASVTANGEKLANGVSVKVSLDTYTAENAMLIPYGAVYYDDGKAYVYVAKGGKAVRTYIDTGIFDDERIVVNSGLSDGDDIITTWSPQLADGVSVEIVPGSAAGSGVAAE